MDTTGPAKTPLQISAQRRFFQWAVKWFYTQLKEEISVKPDVPSLVMLLQAVGFQLREFEKDELLDLENATKQSSIKLTIKCGTSKMKAVLEMDEIECQCPSESKGGSVWSICGTGPASNDSASSSKFEESGSNLLPTIPKGVNNVVRDVVYRLIKMINSPLSIDSANSENDLNVSALGNVEATPDLKRTESKDVMFRSYTQPNIPSIRVHPSNKKFLTSKNLFRSTFNSNDDKLSIEITKKALEDRDTLHLQRQKTWDMDLDVDIDVDSGLNSPKVTSSPAAIDQLYNSLGHISVASDDESMGLIDYVVKAYRSLDKAVGLVIKKVPMTSSTLSLNEQNTVKSTPNRNEGSTSTNSKIVSRPGSACSISSMPSRLPQKTVPLKPPNPPVSRRSVPAAISRKSMEKARPSPGGDLTKTSVLQKSFTTTTGPQKSIPPRLLTTRPRTSSTSSMNNTTLSDRVINSAKKGVSSDAKNSPSVVRKGSLGANTSIKGPTAISKPTKFGFSRNKPV